MYNTTVKHMSFQSPPSHKSYCTKEALSKCSSFIVDKIGCAKPRGTQVSAGLNESRSSSVVSCPLIAELLILSIPSFQPPVYFFLGHHSEPCFITLILPYSQRIPPCCPLTQFPWLTKRGGKEEAVAHIRNSLKCFPTLGTFHQSVIRQYVSNNKRKNFHLQSHSLPTQVCVIT